LAEELGSEAQGSSETHRQQKEVASVFMSPEHSSLTGAGASMLPAAGLRSELGWCRGEVKAPTQKGATEPTVRKCESPPRRDLASAPQWLLVVEGWDTGCKMQKKAWGSLLTSV
jgi:hypothetical protein